MVILCFIFLPNDRAHAIPAEIDTTIKPTPVTDNVTGVMVEPIITTVWTDSIIDVMFYVFLFVFLFMALIFEVRFHFFNVFN